MRTLLFILLTVATVCAEDLCVIAIKQSGLTAQKARYGNELKRNLNNRTDARGFEGWRSYTNAAGDEFSVGGFWWKHLQRGAPFTDQRVRAISQAEHGRGLRIARTNSIAFQSLMERWGLTEKE